METLALRDFSFNKLDFVIVFRCETEVYFLIRFQQEII